MSKNDERVAALCAALEKEPLFHMSLGSKELFHSNFLAWFANSFPEHAAAVFHPWTAPMTEAQAGRSERERGHLDLILHLPGLAPIAIENKMFSVPNEVQLDRYAEGVLAKREEKGCAHSCILLSLMPPSWTRYKGWQWLSYRELAEALSSQVAHIHAADAFASALVRHYVELINILVELFEHLGTPASDEPLRLDNAVKICLEQARISAGVQKARASYITHQLRSAVRHKRWSGICVDDNFTHDSLIEGFCSQGADGNNSAGDALGWQLEGTQFRLAVITSQLHGRKHRQEREAYVAERYGDWFDFTLFGEVTGAKEKVRAHGRKDFQGYDPAFVYRYSHASQLTPSQIVEMGLLYLDRARQMLMANGEHTIPLLDDEQ